MKAHAHPTIRSLVIAIIFLALPLSTLASTPADDPAPTPTEEPTLPAEPMAETFPTDPIEGEGFDMAPIPEPLITPPVGDLEEPAFSIQALTSSYQGNGLATEPQFQIRPALAYNSATQQFLAVWMDGSALDKIRGRLMDRDGFPVGPSFLIATKSVGGMYTPRVLYSSVSNTYLVAWIEPNGQPSDETYCLGSQCVTVHFAKQNLYVRAFSATGEPLTTAPVLLSTEVTPFGQTEWGFDVVYNNQLDEFLVQWPQPRGAIQRMPNGYNALNHFRIIGQRLAPDGTLRGGQVLLYIGADRLYHTAYSPTSNEYFTTIGIYYNGPEHMEIIGRRYNANTLAAIGGNLELSARAADEQTWANIAYDPTLNRYLISFWDAHFTPDQIRTVLVQGGTGTLLRGTTQVSNTTDTPAIFYPYVTYSLVEQRYLVAMTTNGGFKGRYISNAGVPIDTAVFDIGTGGLIGGLAASTNSEAGTARYVAVWEASENIYSGSIPPILTPFSPVTISITDSTGNLVEGLALNDDGWPTLNVADGARVANPLTVDITLNCSSSGAACENSPLRFDIYDSSHKARLYLAKAPDEIEFSCGQSHSGTDRSYTSYGSECVTTNAAVGLNLEPGETKSLRWSVWVQPSQATSLQFTAAWQGNTANNAIQVPLAAIHPIVFLPGLGATLPPVTDQWRAHQVLSIANLVAHYNDLYAALEKMGYEMDKTLFLFPYDWLRSNIFSARLLRERLETESQTVAAVPWAASSGNPANITFDLIGHSTGNLVARTYLQVSDGVDPATGNTFPIWNGHVRKWVSIAGPLQGIYDGYQVFEGVAIPDTPLDPVWMAFNIFAPPRAVKAGYAKGVCVQPPWLQPCVYYWNLRDKYLFAHDPFEGPSILPEFFPVYTFADGNHYLTSGQPLQYPETPLGDLPFGRLANPLLDDASVVNGNIQDPVNVLLAQQQYLSYDAIQRAVMLTSMRGKVYDPYVQNPFLGNRAPVGYETTYYGLNTEEGIQTLDEHLGGIDNNLCLIYGGGSAEDTHIQLNVYAPGVVAPYWFSGSRIGFGDGTGDGYVFQGSSSPDNLWVELAEPPLAQDVDAELILHGKQESNHKFIVGYDESIRHITQCLNDVTIPAGLLSGFSSSQNGEAQANEARLTKNILSITALSPVELTLTDSLGHRLGYDSQTGTDLSEIPDALYVRDSVTDEKYLLVYAAEAGNYTLTVTSIGEGDYTIVGTFKQDDLFVSPLFIQGTVSPGEQFTQSFTLAQSAADMPVPPSVSAGLIMSATEGSLVQFSGSATDINPGDTLSYHWDLGDGTIIAGTLSPTHIFADDGVYEISLTVSDSSGYSVSDSFSLAVNNAPPVVEAGNDQNGSRWETLNFSGSVSDRGLVDTHVIAWDFGDGSSSQGELNVCHAYAGPGTYVVTLTVTDDEGAIGQDQLQVTITDPLASFVVFGQEGVWLKANATVRSGDVGTNVASPGPYLSDQSETVVGEHVEFTNPASRIVGDSLLIRQGAEVYDVYYNQLDGNGTILGTHHTPLTLPVMGALPPIPEFVPGSQNLEVRPNGTLTLAAGNYGRLVARSKATITFSGGLYIFSQWDIGEDVKLYFAAPTEIRIAGKLDTNAKTYVGPAPGANGVTARDIVIIVAGTNGNNGAIHANPSAAQFGERNIVIANVFVPNGTLWLKANTTATGAFVARWVIVGERVELTLASAY